MTLFTSASRANATPCRAMALALLAFLLAHPTSAAEPRRSATSNPRATAAPPLLPNFDEMARDFTPAAAQPDSAMANLRQALVQYRAGEYANAIASAQSAIGRLPSDGNAHAIIGLSWVRLGQFEKGLESLQTGVRLEPQNLSVLIAIANAHLLRGDLAEARSYFSRIGEGWPGHSEASQGLGLVAEREGKLEDAAAHLEAAVAKLPPEAAGVKLNLARIYNRQRKFEQTIALLGEFAHRKPVNESAVEFLALAYLGAGRVNEAMAAYRTAFEASPSAPLALGLGLSYRQANQLPDSAKYLEQAAAMRANWPAAWLQLAETRIAMADFPAALTSLNRARALGAEPLPVDLRIADVHLLAQAPGKAIEVLRNVSRYAAGELSVWDRLGSAYQVAGDIVSAERTFKEAAERFPTSALPPYRLGLLQERTGRLSDAVPMLQAAASLEPENAAVQRALAAVYLKSGQTSRATAMAERLVERQPGDADARLFLAQLYGQAGASSRAAAVYREVLAQNPNHPIALNNLAMIHARSGEFDDALRYSRRAVALVPESGQLLDTLGWVCYLKGDLTDATETLKRAAQQSPRDPSIQFHLGMALHKRNQNPEALRCFERAVDLSQDFAEYKQAAEMIQALRS